MDEDSRVQQHDIVVPHFGHTNHVSIDRRYGIIRRQKVTDGAAYEGARLREVLIDPPDTALCVRADKAP